MLSRRAGNLVDIAAVACLRADAVHDPGSERPRRRGMPRIPPTGAAFDWSPHPTKDEVRHEYERIWQQLGSRSIEELVDLPLMSDPEFRATLDVLTEVVTPALFTDENLLSLVICRMVNLSLEHGNSDGSCFAYVWLGMILGPHFGDYQAGFRFGRLGYDLVEKRGLNRYQARPTCPSGISSCPGRDTSEPAGIWCVAPSTPQTRSATSPLRHTAATT